MVDIRTLKPQVRIRMPAKPRLKTKPQYKVVVRYRRDYPPPTPQPTACVLWQGVEGTDGYGRRKVREGGVVRSMSMHRWVMEQLLGRRLRSSEVVLHACDNRLCYRADHLSVGTVADNNADMRAKGRDSKPPVNVFYGECHPMAKLSAHQVRAIRGHYQSGLRPKTIAAMFDVAPSTVRRIVREVRWQLLGDEAEVPGAKIRPPTRDLVAEIAAERAVEAAPVNPKASPEPTKRVKSVKKMNIRSMQAGDPGAVPGV